MGMSARSRASATSARSGVSVASARSNVSAASGVSGNNFDGDESLDSVSVLPSPASSTGGRSGGSRTSRVSRLSSALPTLPEGEKEESPRDGSESDISASPGNSCRKRRSQSQMTYESSDDDGSISSSDSHVSSKN